MRPDALVATSWYKSSARERLAELLDPGSFTEIIPPTERCISPHLAGFDLPSAFDDGIVIGSGRLEGNRVLVAAQESSFLGGTFGEVHGAKMIGLLRAAAGSSGVSAVLLLLDTGGVRLQEANAGEIAVGQAIVALLEARAAGVPVLALIGGRAGCFGGGGLIAGSCSAVVISEQGRLGVSGPEVIETNRGVEEFDARDRPLVWRITGGRTRRLLGIADAYVEDTIDAFRTAANRLLADAPPLDLPVLLAEHETLAQRLAIFGDCRDAPEICAAPASAHRSAGRVRRRIRENGRRIASPTGRAGGPGCRIAARCPLGNAWRRFRLATSGHDRYGWCHPWERSSAIRCADGDRRPRERPATRCCGGAQTFRCCAVRDAIRPQPADPCSRRY